jgi:sugar fermentation stimulation protein A
MTEIYRYPALSPGRLLRRYKRFLADVELSAGETVAAFCPNSGSMKGCSEPGSRVMLSPAGSPGRKTGYTLEMVMADGVWVGVNTLLTNRLAHNMLSMGLIEELAPYRVLRREASCGDSRLDFLLGKGERRCYLEVKNVTLREGAACRFPDAVTLRGLRHLHALMGAVGEGHGAFMLYVVQRKDCGCFAPAEDIDPGYSRALRLAVRRGVKALAYGLEVSPEGVSLSGRLPLIL